MKRKFILSTILLTFASATIICCGTSEKKEGKTEEAKTDVYTCPMKCNNGQTYDKAGNCPVCEMELEKVNKS